MKPRLLDLFCGAGGAAMGYSRAGFEVVGVDINPQPNYPFEFIQYDVLAIENLGYTFDAIHASPPCQAYSRTARLHPEITYPRLIEQTRDLLEQLGLPWVIENTPPAPIRPDYQLCGTMFGLKTRRHRWFEASGAPLHLHHPCNDHSAAPVQVFGHGGDSSKYWTMDEWREAMGIDWMTRGEMAEAIPPAYTEFIGKQLLELLTPSSSAPKEE